DPQNSEAAAGGGANVRDVPNYFARTGPRRADHQVSVPDLIHPHPAGQQWFEGAAVMGMGTQGMYPRGLAGGAPGATAPCHSPAPTLSAGGYRRPPPQPWPGWLPEYVSPAAGLAAGGGRDRAGRSRGVLLVAHAIAVGHRPRPHTSLRARGGNTPAYSHA